MINGLESIGDVENLDNTDSLAINTDPFANKNDWVTPFVWRSRKTLGERITTACRWPQLFFSEKKTVPGRVVTLGSKWPANDGVRGWKHKTGGWQLLYHDRWRPHFQSIPEDQCNSKSSQNTTGHFFDEEDVTQQRDDSLKHRWAGQARNVHLIHYNSLNLRVRLNTTIWAQKSEINLMNTQERTNEPIRSNLCKKKLAYSLHESTMFNVQEPRKSNGSRGQTCGGDFWSKRTRRGPPFSSRCNGTRKYGGPLLSSYVRTKAK